MAIYNYLQNAIKTTIRGIYTSFINRFVYRKIMLKRIKQLNFAVNPQEYSMTI